MAEIKRNTRQFVMPVNKWEAVVREGDGFAEDVFNRQGPGWIEHVPEWAAYHVVKMGDIEKVTVDDILDLQVQDQEALFINIRQCIAGDKVNLKVFCEQKIHENGICVDLEEISFTPLPADAQGERPTFVVTLPRSEWECEFGYITGQEELAAVEKIKRGVEDEIALLFESIKRLGPYRKGVDLKLRHFMELLTLDRATIRGAFDKKYCGYDTRYRWNCKTCGGANITSLFSQKGFFVPKV